jgi:outer membrane lipoprotein SlyB
MQSTNMSKRLAVAAIVAVGIAGCGSSSSPGGASAANTPKPNAPEVNPAGDIPDNQAYVRYAPPGAGLSVKVPEGWSRTTAGGAVTFTDKLNAIRIETTKASSPVTVRAARKTVLPALASSVKGFRAGAVSIVTRSAGTALRITYLAAAAPNPVTGKAGQDAVERYVFAHNGRQLLLTLSGPKGADNVDPWRIVTDSVRWTG